ncbi:hypothetical protein F373_gp038 [Bacillus phage SP-10]|uniref:hypothetical protein n=1 Tax=Bacillus phage SP10 TaxID=941058 RepID=UPI0002198AFA|nr:hypothetical protein F373_gp038 [Bacillus phage SP-10]BAK52850.1 hypothetical protein [Bacillus phage SP-10]
MSELRKRYEGITKDAKSPTMLIDARKEEYTAETGNDPTKLILSANMYKHLVMQKFVHDSLVLGYTEVAEVDHYAGMKIEVVRDAEADIKFE